MTTRAAFPSCLPRRGSASAGGFTLVELMVAMALGAVVFGAALTGVVSLQKSYAATEQYAADLADQTRLLDVLAMDLRRANDVSVTPDANGNATAVTVTLPNYYQYDSSTGKAAPNPPSIYLSPPPRAAYYGQLTTDRPTVVYRFAKAAGVGSGPVTREEVRAGAGETGQAPACVPVADRVVRFSVKFDDTNGGDTDYAHAIQARLAATFQPIFQTPALPDPNSGAAPVLTLHGMVFLRNNDSHQ